MVQRVIGDDKRHLRSLQKHGGKTGTMIETATTARSAMAFAVSASVCEDDSTRAYCRERINGLRGKLSSMFSDCDDEELNDIFDSYTNEINKADE